ncbi:hypothetical protein DENSPDRAFT_861789 [Dentipellis sp. KUC8613]|nr:hypothetical protein DENSPDRAFT_861789 [Dentipellis sp. KUC8613]
MSVSPPVRRLSTASTSSTQSKREEDLINAYEAEEERIINVLSRKLEKLQEEKIQLENVLEAESESHVNRLSRELTVLRIAQQQQAQQEAAQPGQQNGNGANGHGPVEITRTSSMVAISDPLTPSTEIMLEAMRRENEQLRNRLVNTEREYIRITRLNEIYREELIDHRRRLGLSVDNLIGLSSSLEHYPQPTHRRSASSSIPSPVVSPSIGLPLPTQGQMTRPGPSPSVPIPRPPSQIHRPFSNLSESNTPISHSPSSSESPFLSSPMTSTNPASLISNQTQMTTPPSSASLALASLQTVPGHPQLSYPSVPPPSLSSSFGSPNIHRDASTSPMEPHASRWNGVRRGSFDRRPIPDVRNGSRSHSRRESVERGARIAETGQLYPRSRTNSIASDAIFPVPSLLATGRGLVIEFLAMSSYHHNPYAADQQQQQAQQQMQQQLQGQGQGQGQQAHAYQAAAMTPSTPGGASSGVSTPMSMGYAPWDFDPSDASGGVQQLIDAAAAAAAASASPQEMYPTPQPTSGHHSPVVIQLEERPPPQSIIRSRQKARAAAASASASASASGESRPEIRVETGGGDGGVARVSPTRVHAERERAHPYRRPQSAEGKPRGGGKADKGARRASDQGYSVRSAAHDAGAGAGPSSSYTSPSDTREDTPSGSGFGASRMGANEKVFGIRSDINYSSATGFMTALLELPGVKRTDVDASISTCQYTQLRQVVVSGRTTPPFTEYEQDEREGRAHTSRQRKYGKFMKRLTVPANTQAHDVSAELQDGILILRIPLTPAITAENPSPQPIIIR